MIESAVIAETPAAVIKAYLFRILGAVRGMLRPRILFRAIWHSLTYRLLIAMLLAPLMYGLAAAWHIYLQAQAGGWDDMPGYFVQPNQYKEAGARWFAGATALLGVVSFVRGIGFKIVRFVFSGLRAAPSGFSYGLATLKTGILRPQVYETLLILGGATTIIADLGLRMAGRYTMGFRKFLLAALVLCLLGALKQANQRRKQNETSGSTSVPALENQFWLWLFAAAVGFLLSYLYYGFVAIAALAAGLYFRHRRLHPEQKGKNNPPPPAASLFLLLVPLCSFGLTLSLLADDGGWPEYTPPQGQPKTIWGYLQTEEGKKIIDLGLIAGWFGAAGGVFGILLGGTLGEALGESFRQNPLGTSAVPPTATGTVRGKIFVKGAAKAGGLRQEGTLHLDDGVVKSVPVLEKVATYTRSERFKRLGLNEAKADFVKDGDHIRLSNIAIQSDGLVRVEGTMLLEGEKLNGQLQVGITPGTLRWIPGAEKKVFNQSRDGFLWTDLLLTGTTAEPKENLTARLVQAAGETLIQEAPAQLINEASKLLLGTGAKDGEKPAEGGESGASNPVDSTIEQGKKVMDLFTPLLRGSGGGGQ